MANIFSHMVDSLFILLMFSLAMQKLFILMKSHLFILSLISLGPLYALLGEVSVQVLCLFFNWIVCLPGMESCEFFLYFGD